MTVVASSKKFFTSGATLCLAGLTLTIAGAILPSMSFAQDLATPERLSNLPQIPKPKNQIVFAKTPVIDVKKRPDNMPREIVKFSPEDRKASENLLIPNIFRKRYRVHSAPNSPFGSHPVPNPRKAKIVKAEKRYYSIPTAAQANPRP